MATNIESKVESNNNENIVKLYFIIFKDWLYDYISEFVKSPNFRVPIKDFIDENCHTFESLEESSFEQTTLHNVKSF